MNKGALFLDRDGIINEDRGYVYRFDDIVWIEETLDLMRFVQNKNIDIFVLTNQSGVEKGMYSEKDVILLHEKMQNYLALKNIHIREWFYCIDSSGENRKPNPGMLYKALKKYQIDLKKSLMIGDKVSDVFLNVNELQTIIVRGAYDLTPLDKKCPIHVKIAENHIEMLTFSRNFFEQNL